MHHTLVFDFGTTAIKGMLIRSDGIVIAEKETVLETIFLNQHVEQDVNTHWEAFLHQLEELLPEKLNHPVGLMMSGQMQDLILLDENESPLQNMILYSDSRALHQATEINDLLESKHIDSILVNNLDGSIPAAKIRWIRDHKPEIWKKTKRFLFSPKDYCLLKLTGKAVLDYTNASTTGLLNFNQNVYWQDMLNTLEILESQLPTLTKTSDIIGVFSLPHNGQEVIVHAGIGDAGATNFASGVDRVGHTNIHLGTSGWISTLTNDVAKKEGVFYLRDHSAQHVIMTVPFFNAGNVHKWAVNAFADGDYDQAEEMIQWQTPLLFLPYLVGERFPIVDTDIRGTYYGISPETTKAQLLSSAIESVTYSIRQGIELMDTKSTAISVIGGGARSKKWMQLFSNTLKQSISVYEHSEYQPALSLSALVFSNIDNSFQINDFLSKIRKTKRVNAQQNTEMYNDHKYSRFLKLYPAIKQIDNIS